MLGQVKSLIGTSTFIVTSVLILIGFVYLSNMPLSLAAILGLAYFAALIENIGVHGLDNLLVPLLVASVLVGIT